MRARRSGAVVCCSGRSKVVGAEDSEKLGVNEIFFFAAAALGFDITGVERFCGRSETIPAGGEGKRSSRRAAIFAATFGVMQIKVLVNPYITGRPDDAFAEA